MFVSSETSNALVKRTEKVPKKSEQTPENVVSCILLQIVLRSYMSCIGGIRHVKWSTR